MLTQRKNNTVRNGCKITIQGGQDRYWLIDFARGFSILTIVLMHLMQSYITELPQLLKTAAALGGTGVHIFIFCSGFGLYLSHLKKPLCFSAFIKKRVGKIYIPYIVVVLISFFVPLAYSGNDRVTALLSHVFLFKMFIPAYEESFGGQLWFISTIIQFYLAFCFLCFLHKKLGRNYFVAVCTLTSIAWWIFTTQTGLYTERIWGSFFLQYIWEFGLGMSCADYLYEGKNIVIPKWLIYIAAVIGIGLEGFLALAGGFLKSFNDIFAFFGYGAIILILYFIDSKFIKSVLIGISSISYEWYLVHMLTFSLIFAFCPASVYVQIAVGVAAFLVSLAIAAGYHLLIKMVSIKSRQRNNI